jgi:hypothetical protein
MDNTELIFESANMLVSNCNQKLYQHEARVTISSFASVLNHSCSSMCAAAYAICYYCSFRILVDIMVKLAMAMENVCNCSYHNPLCLEHHLNIKPQ